MPNARGGSSESSASTRAVPRAARTIGRAGPCCGRPSATPSRNGLRNASCAVTVRSLSPGGAAAQQSITPPSRPPAQTAAASWSTWSGPATYASGPVRSNAAPRRASTGTPPAARTAVGDGGADSGLFVHDQDVRARQVGRSRRAGRVVPPDRHGKPVDRVAQLGRCHGARVVGLADPVALPLERIRREADPAPSLARVVGLPVDPDPAASTAPRACRSRRRCRAGRPREPGGWRAAGPPLRPPHRARRTS